MMRVTIYVQAYNTEKYLPACVESILAQTVPDFELILIDDGSTDSTPALMKEYAVRDRRVRALLLPENRKRPAWLDVLREKEKNGVSGAGESPLPEFIAIIDADDWWEPDYLEHLLSLAEQTKADMVSTGVWMHRQSDGALLSRALDRPPLLLAEGAGFADEYPYYHKFFRTYWGKLIRRELFRRAEFPEFDSLGTMYGWDTITTMALLRQARKIAVDASMLYHYRLYTGSVSGKYDAHRFDSDLYCYYDAVDFLSAFGAISPLNDVYISAVFANAVKDTVDSIEASALPPLEKLGEYRRILTHPLTQEISGKGYPQVQIIGRRLMRAIAACGDSLLR